MTAEVIVPDSGAEGVIVAQGGKPGGGSLYAKNGKLKYCYKFYGINYYYIKAYRPIPSGQHPVCMEFTYGGGGIAKGGTVALFHDGEQVWQGRLDMTEPFIFSADETCDVGKESGSPVWEDYGPKGNEFSGEVNWVLPSHLVQLYNVFGSGGLILFECLVASRSP